jgi:hypothetical protein
MNAIVDRSPSGAARATVAPADFGAGWLSPVSAASSIAPDPRDGREHRAQRVKRSLRSVLLDEAEDRVEQYHHEHDDRSLQFA